MKKITDINLSMFGGMILYFLGHPMYEKWGNLNTSDREILAKTFLEQDFAKNIFGKREIEFVSQQLKKQTT